MLAGPHIQSQVASNRQAAEEFRQHARILRARADEYDQKAAEADRDADRWAAGTDIANITQAQEPK